MLDVLKTKIAIWKKNITLKSTAFYLNFLKFSSKKKPKKSFIYPFSEIEILQAFPELQTDNCGRARDYNRLFKLLKYLKKFTLIGDNWLEADALAKKPIAMLWGFNDWKLGFISDYLPEYRTVFTPRKFLNIAILKAIYKFPQKPSVFIVWGYTESFWVRLASKLFEIPIYRMEDGFVRSVELGANHSTPYSLVVDKKGLYYNGYQQSDLENILNQIDLSQNDVLCEQAKKALEVLLEYDISKYNLPDIHRKSEFVFGSKKRILVIGQVDNDASLRYGNPHKYTMEQVIKIAKYENPLADILYRPHPEVYKGFQKSKLHFARIKDFVAIVSPKSSLPEILKTVDHVYVITSLVGIEALLRDIPVTVFGTPFYAGWGLTDDRVICKRRTKKLTKLELFAGAYLKYPRYLADLHNVDIGFFASCLRINSDREIALYKTSSRFIDNDLDKTRLIAHSKYWPQLLVSTNITQSNLDNISKALDMVNLDELLGGDSTNLVRFTFIYAVCGLLQKDKYINNIFTSSSKYFDIRELNKILINMDEYYPGFYIIKHISSILEANDENRVALDYLYQKLKTFENFSENKEEEVHSHRYYLDILNQLFDKHLALKEFKEAIEIVHILMLHGSVSAQMILRIAKIADLQFDIVSARLLADLSQKMDMSSERGKSSSVKIMNTEVYDYTSWKRFLLDLALHILIIPSAIIEATFLIKKYAEYIDSQEDFFCSKKMEKIFLAMVKCDNEFTIQKALVYIAMEMPQKALNILDNIDETEKLSNGYKLTYSQTLSYLGELDKAHAIVDNLYKIHPNSAVVREKMRLCVLSNRYDDALKILTKAQHNKVEVGDMAPRKIYFGARMINEAFKTFTQIKIKKTLQTYYSHKYVDDYNKYHNVTLVSVFGPGDEIRFASIYNLLPNHFSDHNISICCDPRLYNLFSVSFPKFKFIATKRLRTYDRYNIHDYNELLGSDLRFILDNNGTRAINNSEGVMMVTDMLHECLKDYSSFLGVAYLKHDEVKSMNFMSRFSTMKKSQDKLLVGLSWRSSLTTHSRNEHYLTIEELEPLFKIDGIQFVNFQYDECSEELAWVEQRYPDKMIHFSDIDHYNDLDSVASLMKCMDLMIAPATTVVELAGALGCKTWLLSNSSELHWRKIDDKGTDVWHNSITHIEGILGDKESLVKNIEVRLYALVKNMQISIKDNVLTIA